MSVSKNDLTNMVVENMATNICCYKTGEPIFPNEGYYVLAGEYYCEKIDIDKEIQDVTDGEYKTAQELYSDDDDFYYWTENYDDFYYWTENYDDESVVQEIIEQSFYYDKQGNIIYIAEL